MDEQEYFDRLDPTASDPGDLFEHFERRSADGRRYHVLSNARHDVERGTVVFEDVGAIVRGYPKIPRVLVLETGMVSVFDGEVAIEEKLDGVNVRISDVGEPLAFTRSGYVCPYTTARARSLLDLPPFFRDHPEMMLCAELIGPETPYTTHDYDNVDSHAFRVFDIRHRESGEPVGVSERRELCAEYGFSQPRLFGRDDPLAAVERTREAIDTLDEADREGVVLKSSDGTEMAKYTTPSQHHEELAYAFSLPFDRGQDFLFSRVVREAFQAAEAIDRAEQSPSSNRAQPDDEQLRERAHQLGESILLPMVETINDAADDETIGERFTVRGTPTQIDQLLEHFYDQSLTLEVESDRRENGQRVVEFVKVAESTRDRIQHYLEEGVRRE